MTGIEHARAAIESLRASVKALREESDVFYAAGDNMHGNRAFDAAAILSDNIDYLTSIVSDRDR